MIPVRSDVKVWVAAGHTDMRKGMMGLALLVQEGLKRDPHAGDLFIFRGRGGDLLKILWHDGLGVSLYAKRLDAAASSGRPPRRAWSASAPPRWPTCWRVSTGATRRSPGGRARPDSDILHGLCIFRRLKRLRR